MNPFETPVLLLTGYLGSGKTTLLNRILTNERGIRFAVIVNDIGEVNIDASLIQRGGIVDQQDDSLVALQNGCICCTLKTDLIEQLHDIIAMQRFDYIVIEASGICEPGPIAQTICSIPAMGEQYTHDGIPVIDSIVTVVDAFRMQTEFSCGEGLMRPGMKEEDIENLVIQQIEFCNIVLLNKASLVQPEQLERVTRIIRALQPQAEIIPCDFGNVPLEKILHTGMFNFDKVATSATWISVIENHHGEEEEHHHHHHEHGHEHHHHHHDGCHCHDPHCSCHHHHHGEGEALEYGIETFVYYRRQPMDMVRFDDFVARRWPRSIIRAKGICYFKGETDTCYVFEQAGQQVQMQNAGQWYATMPREELEMMLHRDANLRKDWDEHYGDRMQKLVFIGQKMDRQDIIRQLDECLVNP